MLIALGQSLIYVQLGMFGPPGQLSTLSIVMLVFQLLASTLIVIMLDDLIVKGYGLGSSGTNFFMSINVALTLLWSVLSPIRLEGPRGLEAEGILFALLGVLFDGARFDALQRVLFREDMPNLMNLIGSILVFLIGNFFACLKV
jgi:protein transport protein SEC61 subunit alpha